MQVGQGFADDAAGAGVAVGSGREAECLLPGGKFGDEFRDRAVPGSGDPAAINLPAHGMISTSHGGRIEMS